jgi:hypothetical protein
MHYIQTHILDQLIHTQVLRNRDMRPANIESNLYQYHLLQLQKLGFVEKIENGYTLTGPGLAYADRHSSSLKKTRLQPKLITTIFLTNKSGEILLVPKKRQPFMGMMNLPSGKIHLNETVEEAAKREIHEKVSPNLKAINLEHVGTAHMTIKQSNFIISDYISLLLHVSVSSSETIENGKFYSIEKISQLTLVPSVSELVQAFAGKKLFSEKIIST